MPTRNPNGLTILKYGTGYRNKFFRFRKKHRMMEIRSAAKFATGNALIGLLIGIYITYTAIGKGYWIFIPVAVLSAFFTGLIFWKLIMRNSVKKVFWKLILTGLMTGIISHVISWVLLLIGTNICFWLTGDCAGSLNQSPVPLEDILSYALFLSAWSLLFFGWISVPASIFIAILVSRSGK